MLSKVREDMVGGPSKVLTPKTVVDETHIRKSANVCKWIFGETASQIQPCSMWQPMSTGLHTRYEFDADLQRFKPRQKKSISFEVMVMPYFQRMRPDCRIESFYTTDLRKRLTVSMHMVSVVIATQCLKQLVVSIITVTVRMHGLPLLKKKFNGEQEKGNG